MARRRSPTANWARTVCSRRPRSRPSALRSMKRNLRSSNQPPVHKFMENIGALAILLAFCFAVYSVVASVVGKLAKRPFLILSAERAVYSIWVLLTVAAGLLIYALIQGDYRLSYVYSHSNRSMPTIYK